MKKRIWILVAMIVLAAVAIRWTWAAPARLIRWDEADYLILARNILRGDGYQVFGVPELHWPPGAPLLAAAAHAAGVPLERALTLWHVVAGTVACGLLFGLSREVTGNTRIAAIAAILCAASPSLAVWPLYWGSLTGPILLMLLLGGLWSAWRMLTTGSIRAAIFAGALFCAAYLTRPEGIGWWGLFLVIGAGVVLWRRRAARADAKLTARLGWRSLAAYALVFVLLAAPNVIFLYRNTGKLMIGGKSGITLYMSAFLVQEGTIGQDSASMFDSTGSEIMWLSPAQFEYSLPTLLRSDPISIIKTVRQNIVDAFAAVESLLGPLMLSLAALGLFCRRWDRKRLRAEGFWLASMLPFAVPVLYHVETRYLAPLLPLVMVWVARGLVQMGDWAAGFATARLQPRTLARGATILALAFVLLVNLAQQPAAAYEGQAGLMPSRQAAALWLTAHSSPDEKVMARNTEIALYADRSPVALPDATWEQIIGYAKARDARYLVTDDWEIGRLRPQMAALLQPDAAPPEVEYLASFEDSYNTTFVYRLVD